LCDPVVCDASLALPRSDRPSKRADELFGDPSTFLPEIRCAVSALDRHVPVHDVRTMDQVVATARSRGCLRAMVLGVFGLTAIVLAAVGMYGELRTRVQRGCASSRSGRRSEPNATRSGAWYSVKPGVLALISVSLALQRGPFGSSALRIETQTHQPGASSASGRNSCPQPIECLQPSGELVPTRENGLTTKTPTKIS